MATSTYTPIASITLGSSASSVTFSSIPQDYRDLVLVFNGTVDNGFSFELRFNSDSTGHYSFVRARGTGSTADSESGTTDTGIRSTGGDLTNKTITIQQIMDYSATDKHKTVITRDNSNRTSMIAARWPDTSAVTTIDAVTNGNFDTGSTFALYGIEA